MSKKVIKIVVAELLIIVAIFSYFFFRNNMHITSIQNTLSIYVDKNQVQTLANRSKLYIELEEGLLEAKDQINIKDISIIKEPNEIFSILEEISNSNPEVMYYKGAEYRFGKLTLYYSKSREDIKKHQKEIRVIRENFISKYITPMMSDYEKSLIIHDYIINSSKYDERLITKGVVPPESYSSYGILSQGIGVCESYAKSMKYLMDGVGMESILVIGESKGENHAWNLVNIEDEYYHIDSTWNDPITSDGSNVLRYNYFNLDDNEMSKTHSWHKEDYPVANGKRYNYFIYNNLIVLGKNELKNKLKNILLAREATFLVKIKDFSDIDYSLNDMIEKIAYENYELIKLKGYSYSIDEEHGIITFEFYYK